LQTLGTIPAAGERCQVAGTKLIVKKVSGQRIDEIEMRLARPAAAK